MRKHLNKVIGVISALSPLLLATAVWAAGGGEHGGEEHHGVTGAQLAGLFFFAVNFGLFLLLLRKFVLPFIKESLHKRKEAVVQALNEAKLAQEEAEKVRREYEEKLAGLEAEQEAMRTQALESAQREKERILAEASRMADRARVEAQQIADREVEQARRTLRGEVAEQAVQIATDLIRSRLNPADRSRFVKDLVDEVSDASSS
jgi:F-type H+-transporting ATPase subunit b